MREKIVRQFQCKYPGQRGPGKCVFASTPKMAAESFYKPGASSDFIVLVDKIQYQIYRPIKAQRVS